MADAEQFGRYTIAGRLGEGGFATVYRAWDPALSREVALKALLPHLADNREIYRRFMAEAQALAGLHHPNIVQVHDVGDEGGRPFFTMQLIRGQTLSAAMRSGRPDLAQATEIVRRLGSALDALHAAGLVHRDIKPANVMLEQGGRVVLMDLGIARSLMQTQITQTGASLGTPAYMAPEQVRGLPVTPAADVYALGILTYHLFAGHPPFEGDTAYVLHAHAFDAPPPLHDLRPDLPAYVYAAIDSALAKSPEQRPPSAGAFAAALAGESSDVEPPSTDPTTWLDAPLEPTLITRRPTAIAPPLTLVTPAPSALAPDRRSRLPLVLASIAVIGAGLALGIGVALAVHSRGGGNGGRQSQTLPTATPVLLTGVGQTPSPASTPSPLPTPQTTSSPSPSPIRTPSPPPPPAATFTDFSVRAADQWGSGAGPLQGCFSFDQAPTGTLVRLRLARQQDAQSPIQDVSQTLGAERGSVCIDARPTGPAAPGNYVAVMFDRDWRQLASAGFNVAPRPTPPTNTSTTRPTFTSTQPPPTRTATSAALPAPPNLSGPTSTTFTGPVPKIVSVTPLGAARTGGVFEFSVVAKNLGASGGLGTISVSSPNQRDLTAVSGGCGTAAQLHTYPPGTRVTTFSSGLVSTATASRDPLAELELASGWPASDQCTLDVKVPALSGPTATFYLRMTVLVSGTQQVASWPLSSSVSDQQGLPVVRWDVPIGP